MSVVRVVSRRLQQTTNFSSYAVTALPHPKPKKFGVPSLQQSIEKYLTYSKPLVPREQWEKTREIVSEYVTSPHVKQLQESLERRARMEDNWLFDLWLDTYLSNRDPVTIHSNPGMRMKTVPFRSDHEWLIYATGIVKGILRFKEKLEIGSLPTERTSGGDAMCMAQYYAILRNCRIPGFPKDRLLLRRGGPYSTLTCNHICVFYQNRVFRLDFRDSVTHEMISETLLYRQLEHIVSVCRNSPPAPPVGLLTSLPRDDWVRHHRLLSQSVFNANTLTDLERSLFVLCLDDSAQLPSVNNSPEQLDKRDTVSAENLLHGQLVNSGNRWFDKSVQFVISRDGSVGANFEHTAADAGALVPMISDIYEVVYTEQPIGVARLPLYARPRELAWSVPHTISEEFERAAETLKQLIESVEVKYSMFREFGSDTIKLLGASPDAFVQIALQLAYSRIHPDQLPPPTYETGSLRRFHLGRTDTIRACSEESVQFTKAMADSSVQKSDRISLLRAALNRHQDYTKDVLSGQAFDRHLFGLRVLASSLTHLAPETSDFLQLLFNDHTYIVANRYRLSTSQVRSRNDCSVLFGPVMPDGYGLCYNVHRNSVQMTATSFRNSSVTHSPTDLLSQVFHALLDMRALLESTSV